MLVTQIVLLVFYNFAVRVRYPIPGQKAITD